MSAPELACNVEAVPGPRPGPASRPFWDGCAAGELRVQRCTACAEISVLPAMRCAGCGATALVWEATAGRGALYSWTVVHRPQSPAFAVPYAPAIVRLDEGAMVMSAVIGCTADDLHDGMRLRVVFRALTDGSVCTGTVLPFFEPDPNPPTPTHPEDLHGRH